MSSRRSAERGFRVAVDGRELDNAGEELLQLLGVRRAGLLDDAALLKGLLDTPGCKA